MSDERAEDLFRVREATFEDHPILQLILDGSLNLVGAKVYDMTANELIEHNRVYMAFLDERPMGCVMATKLEPIVLHCLHVVPEHRGTGHAGMLLASAITDMDKVEPADFWTAIDPDRRSGVERCLSLGFRQVQDDFTELKEPLNEMWLMMRAAHSVQASQPTT